MGGSLFVWIALVAVALSWWSWQRAKHRRDELFAFAAAHNLAYTREDPFGLLDLDFPILAMGDGRGVENVLAGTWDGVPVREADYWYYTESRDAEGHTSRDYRSLSILLSDLGAVVPAVSIRRESVLTRLAGHLGMRDIEFESEEFNRRFRVTGPDREFAFELVDARMMRWLLEAGETVAFEVSGRHLLTWCDAVRPSELQGLFDTAAAFRRHVPRLVWTKFGTGNPPAPPTKERSAS